MITRAIELLEALGGRSSADPRVVLLAERLRASSVPGADSADAILDAVERATSERAGSSGTWILATTAAALGAAVLATRSLSAAFSLLRPYDSELAAFVPLLAFPLALLAWARFRADRRRERGRATFDVAVSLAGAGLPSALAFEVAAYVGGLSAAEGRALAGLEPLSQASPERQHLELMRALEARAGLLESLLGARTAWMLMPMVTAAFVVISYWYLYFNAIAAHALSPWWER